MYVCMCEYREILMKTSVCMCVSLFTADVWEKSQICLSI